MTQTVRVHVIADLLEEHWPSMDLVADMLMTHVGHNGTAVSARLLRPAFHAPLSSGFASFGRSGAPFTVERIAHRYWGYPRWLRSQSAADVYHIVDHSYAHLARELPPERVVVTCHDTDAFRSLMYPSQRESGLPRVLVKRLLDGLRRAAVVVCDSESARRDLVANGLIDEIRTAVVPLGVHPSCTPEPNAEADAAAARLTGPVGGSDLLHVGSTIARKRIDVLLDVVAEVAKVRSDVRLWRVGGDFSSDQRARVRRLGLDGRINVLPFVSRPVLAALYRRSALVLLPSEREGFGLPVAEALGCGTPIIASELPVLREVGGDAAEYCAVGEVGRWAERVVSLLDERDKDPEAWSERCRRGVNRAAGFSWTSFARAMESVYLQVASGNFRES